MMRRPNVEERHLRPYTGSAVEAEIRQLGLPCSRRALYQLTDRILSLDMRGEIGTTDRRWSHDEATLVVRSAELNHIVGLSWASVARAMEKHGSDAWLEAVEELVAIIRECNIDSEARSEQNEE